MTKIERRKQRIVAQGDRLRIQCGDLWGAVGNRAELIEERCLGRLTWLRPVLSVASVIGVSILQQRSMSRKNGRGGIGPVASAVGLAIDLWRRQSAGKLASKQTGEQG